MIGASGMVRPRLALVLGASGMVGSAIMRLLRRYGIAIIGTGFRHLSGPLVSLDLRDKPTGIAFLKSWRPDWIFFPAAWSYVDGCERDPEMSRSINVEPLSWLLPALRSYGGKLLFFSSEYVFSGNGGPYREQDAPFPLSVYGLHKVEAEQQIALLSPEALVVRTTWVYGPDAYRKNFVHQIIDVSRQGRGVDVPMDQVSTPTYVEDLAIAAVRLMSTDETGMWHVAGPERMTRLAWAHAVCEHFGIDRDLIRPVRTEELGRPAARPLKAGLVSTKLIQRAGIRPRDLDSGLRSIKGQEAYDKWQST